MSDEPTIRDVLNAISASETRLGEQLRSMEKRLKNEIDGSFRIHQEQILDLQRRVKDIEKSLSRPH